MYLRSRVTQQTHVQPGCHDVTYCAHSLAIMLLLLKPSAAMASTAARRAGIESTARTPGGGGYSSGGGDGGGTCHLRPCRRGDLTA